MPLRFVRHAPRSAWVKIGPQCSQDEGQQWISDCPLARSLLMFGLMTGSAAEFTVRLGGVLASEDVRREREIADR